MHTLATIPHASVELCWDREISGSSGTRATQLRGALARTFADDDLFHQHNAQGKLLYRYPRVHYRWRRGHGMVVGWEDAAQRLLQLPWLDLSLQLGEEATCITDAHLTLSQGAFGLSERLHHYRLASPVLLFNQENYQKYKGLDSVDQNHERDRLLISSLLIGMRGFQIDFPANLYATFTRVHTGVCHYKRQKLLGIKGDFVSNVALPDGFAIGHGVSHGYGWIEAINFRKVVNK